MDYTTYLNSFISIIFGFYWVQFAKVIRGDIQTVFARLIFTYLIPIAPLVMMFDGFVSIVRIYTKKDLEEIVHSIEVEGYTWEVNMVQTKKSTAYRIRCRLSQSK